MKYTKYEGYYCRVTKENKEILTEVRGWKDDKSLPIGWCVGIPKNLDGKVGHNPTTGNGKNDGYFYDTLVSVEKLCDIVGIKREVNYEIY